MITNDDLLFASLISLVIVCGTLVFYATLGKNKNICHYDKEKLPRRGSRRQQLSSCYYNLPECTTDYSLRLPLAAYPDDKSCVENYYNASSDENHIKKESELENIAEETLISSNAVVKKMKLRYPEVRAYDLNRFLIARKGDFTQACDMYNAYVKWRMANFPLKASTIGKALSCRCMYGPVCKLLIQSTRYG